MMSKDRFHQYSKATSIHKQCMCVLLPTANQSAFSETAFTGLSDVHECSGGLQLALVAIDEKQPGRNSSHNCLMLLCIDVATFCDILSTVGPRLGSFGGTDS